MPTLQLSMPTTQTINAKTVLSLFLALPKLRYPSRLRVQEGLSNLDLARSILLTEWYDNAADDDLFLFVDSDQTFTAEDVHALIDLGGDVAVVACLSREVGGRIVGLFSPTIGHELSEVKYIRI